MKKLTKKALIISFMLLANYSAFACDLWTGGCGHGGTTTAPIDGGLLAILIGAGITYFAIRKKKKG